MEGTYSPQGNDHSAATATWLTNGHSDQRTLDASGPSFDQIAAARFQDSCVVPALPVSARGSGFFASDIPRNTPSRGARPAVIAGGGGAHRIGRMLGLGNGAPLTAVHLVVLSALGIPTEHLSIDAAPLPLA